MWGTIMEKFRTVTQKYHDEIVAQASRLIQINSQSKSEGELAKYVTERMKQLGYDEVISDRWGNVYGVMHGTGGGSSVTLNCHLDVVYESDPGKWKYPPFSGTVAEGKIWGRGASDTKGTFAIQLYTPVMLKELGMLPKGDIVVSGVVCEEIGGFGAMMQTNDGFMLTDYVVIGEASENDLAVSCRGRCCCKVTIKGKSCHASTPYLGKNPFDVLGPLLYEIKNIPLGHDENMGYSTITATNVETSEKGTNIIQNEIVLYIDYRQVPCDTTDVAVEKVRQAVERCSMDDFEVTVEASRSPVNAYTGECSMGFDGEPPFGVSAEEDYVVFCKQVLENAVGHEVKTKGWNFATDTGHYAQKGCKCIGYSPAEAALCHTTEDNIDIEMMKEAEIGYLALAYNLANRDKYIISGCKTDN